MLSSFYSSRLTALHFGMTQTLVPSRLRRGWFQAAVLLAALCLVQTATAQELKFPQIITIRYEAKDPRAGGQFIIWVEREKIWYGIDSKFGADTKVFPSAKTVDVMHITPAPGTTTITIITVTSVNSDVPDYFHLSGNVRFKISGMRVTSSNIP